MKTLLFLLLSLAFLTACQTTATKSAADPAQAEAAIKVVLDSMHQAFAENRADDYMNNFTEDAHILGTDPGEDWSKASFTEYYKTAVAKGFTGNHTTSGSLIVIAPDGKNAVTNLHWRFPSLLQNGDVRLTYNWIQTEGGWKCNYLSISVIPPNAKMAAVDSTLGVVN